MEVHGIPKKENDDVFQEINKLAERLALPTLTMQDIEAVHRLPAKEGKTPPILVRFTERAKRDLWMTKRTALRHDNIYVNENLTKQLKALFWKAKQQAREKGYRFVWTRNGKIYVRKGEGTAVVRIEKDTDLIKIH